MTIKRIHWKDTLDLRHKVLWPNKPKEFCFVDGDKTANHYGLFLKGNLIAVASTFYTNNNVQLRKFAVDVNYQGEGYGSQLLTHIIASEKNNHKNKKQAVLFWCDARESAINFYKRFGLLVTSDVFYKSKKPYLKMAINLL